MAYRAPKSGIAADIQRKRQSEYKVSMENEVVDWIEYVLNEGKGEFVDFHEWLLDGTILCKLFNCIEQNKISSKHFRPTPAPFKQLDNINVFLLACKDYGVKEGELFVSLDLHEANDLAQVISSIFALERVAFRKGWIGPRLKSREHTRKVLRLSRERLNEDYTSYGMWNQGGLSKRSVSLISIRQPYT